MRAAVGSPSPRRRGVGGEVQGEHHAKMATGVPVSGARGMRVAREERPRARAIRDGVDHRGRNRPHVPRPPPAAADRRNAPTPGLAWQWRHRRWDHHPHPHERPRRSARRHRRLSRRAEQGLGRWTRRIRLRSAGRGRRRLPQPAHHDSASAIHHRPAPRLCYWHLERRLHDPAAGLRTGEQDRRHRLR